MKLKPIKKIQSQVTKQGHEKMKRKQKKREKGGGGGGEGEDEMKWKHQSTIYKGKADCPWFNFGFNFRI